MISVYAAAGIKASTADEIIVGTQIKSLQRSGRICQALPYMKSSAKAHAGAEDEKPTQTETKQMEAIRMRIQKNSRPLVILLAIAVAIITSMVVANATQTITTPNAAFISYNLAAGANSAAITPAASRAVLVMGCCTTGEQGVGHVSLLRIPSSFIEWVGLESPSQGGSLITSSGGTATAGTHIVCLSFHCGVEIQVASADTILIHNTSLGTLAGNVTLIW